LTKRGRKLKIIAILVFDATKLTDVGIKLNAVAMPHGKLLFGISSVGLT